MPRGPRGEKRPAAVIGAAVMVARIATGEIAEKPDQGSAAPLGAPNAHSTSTSYAERQNLTMRMQMRRFTRLTNAFSKKFDNHCQALALYFVRYNFVKVHKTLRMSPAMAGQA
jgi:hypothetical protein